jgi:hypothetical protein
MTQQNQPAPAPRTALYGGRSSRRITVRDIAAAKERGEKWPMLTAYDAMTAAVFDEAGIPVLLVGDSMGNAHLGYDSTVPVTLDQMTMLSAAVVRGTSRSGAQPASPISGSSSSSRMGPSTPRACATRSGCPTGGARLMSTLWQAGGTRSWTISSVRK